MDPLNQEQGPSGVGPAADAGMLEAAVAIATEAGELTQRYFNQPDLAVDIKGDGSPVTEADRHAETLIRDRISEQFPDDDILGEEHGTVVGSSGRRWLVDPIDGTKSFTHGVPLYSNLIALVDGYGPAIGVINLPALDEMVYAGRGLGCFHRVGTASPQPCSVSTIDRLDRAALTASGFEGFPVEVLRRWTTSGAIVRTWGDAYGYALVATGRAEAMFDYGLNAWDIAPMHVIIPEAGGTVTSWSGEPGPMGGNTVASNTLLHEDLLALVREHNL